MIREPLHLFSLFPRLHLIYGNGFEQRQWRAFTLSCLLLREAQKDQMIQTGHQNAKESVDDFNKIYCFNNSLLIKWSEVVEYQILNE